MSAEWNFDEPKRAIYKAWVALFQDKKVFPSGQAERSWVRSAPPLDYFQEREQGGPDRMAAQVYQELRVAPAITVGMEVGVGLDHDPAQETHSPSREHQHSAPRRGRS